ncbi:MAG TPA: acyl-CoA dehydrogenase family protein [Burkholderiales bacterium]|nr:acyl-CoA dehydrogenase family protein [Burkholderiales bacterium]
MDFNYTQEQQMLQDSIEKFLDKNYSFGTRREIIAARKGIGAPAWEGFAELGLLGLPIPPEYGGFGGNAVDTMIVMEALGRRLVVEPYLSTVVLGAGAIVLGGTEAQRRILLPSVVEGSMKLAFAHWEPGSRYSLSEVGTTARQEGGFWVINGRKSVVLHGAVADLLIVSARTSGQSGDAHGISLFFVNPTEPGVAGHDYPTYDGMRAVEAEFTNVHVNAESLIGVLDQAYPLIELVVDRGIAALCAEAVGCMGALNAATLEYLKTRQQFGVPIGRFQALQHRMVDMLIQYEQAKSMACLAAVRVDSPDAGERRRAVSAAKELIGRAGRYVGQQAIQLHGGMGMTDELNVGHYFKRLTAIDATFGDGDHHLSRFAAAESAGEAMPVQSKSRWKQLV